MPSAINAAEGSRRTYLREEDQTPALSSIPFIVCSRPSTSAFNATNSSSDNPASCPFPFPRGRPRLLPVPALPATRVAFEQLAE